MIYCVVPPELEDELFDRLDGYYRDQSDVEVIADRRSGPDRRSGREYGGKRVVRDRRRARPKGSFPPVSTPS